jgi:hypothetical protein
MYCYTMAQLATVRACCISLQVNAGAGPRVAVSGMLYRIRLLPSLLVACRAHHVLCVAALPVSHSLSLQCVSSTALGQGLMQMRCGWSWMP